MLLGCVGQCPGAHDQSGSGVFQLKMGGKWDIAGLMLEQIVDYRCQHDGGEGVAFLQRPIQRMTHACQRAQAQLISLVNPVLLHQRAIDGLIASNPIADIAQHEGLGASRQRWGGGLCFGHSCHSTGRMSGQLIG